MVQPDYRGARGANAGDDFHELWALRQALALLDQDAGLTAVTVEGLRAEDESGTPSDTWDGVDCALYYGGDHAASATRIVVAQLKYSAANPDQPWTVARLTQSSNQKRDNSVIGRLAKAFAGIKRLRPDLVASGNMGIRLVSNQPVDPVVFNALSGQSALDQKPKRKSRPQQARAALIAASGLPDADFETFARAFDLSECGRGSRFALEERVLATIADWTEDDARAALNDLMRSVRHAMMPEAKGEFITRQSVLLWMGFSDERALFPCPSTIKRVDRLIPRGASRIVVERLVSGEQCICLHGEGGCGKTTALQEIEALLPSGSVVILYDCYGSGRYLDSDAYRHRPPDAFLQLSNDLARQLGIPLLISRSANLDYPRTFKRRLEKAAEVVASREGNALLVVIVDAADNSVVAASTRSPQERSFVHDFGALGELPRNVRLVVTARTGRLSMLNLPHDFAEIPLTSFTRDETAVHVRGFWSETPEAWIDDFHYLSHGNPRVQRYALDYAGAEPAQALDHLRPNGKSLEQIFREQLEYARDKAGSDEDIKTFCSGLIALPRPVPIADLAAATCLNEAYICDLSADFAPGVRLTNRSIGEAIEVAGEVNVEAVHEIELFAPLAERAVSSMDANQKRAVARDLAIVVGDAGVRLSSYEHFPWAKATQALTTLDVCLALAVIAQWEDKSLVHRATSLPPLFETALHRRDLSPIQVAALSSLLDLLSAELMVRVVDEARKQRVGGDLPGLTEALAREEVLRFGRGTRQQINEKLRSLLANSAPGFWLDRLLQATAFHQKRKSGQPSPQAEEGSQRYPEEVTEGQPDPLDSLDWAAHRFIHPSEIDDVVKSAMAAARGSKTFIAISTILDRVGSAVRNADRVLHLEALSQATSYRIADYWLAHALARRIEDWHGAPSVSHWCRERLMPVIVDHLPGLSRWLAQGESPLPALLETSGMPSQQITAALIEGM
jgi:hypothetical protein